MLTVTRQVAVLLALTLVLAACANGGSDTGSADSARIRVVLQTTVAPDSGTIGLGVASGTFENAGVVVEIQVLDGAQATNAMAAGRADLVITGPTSASSLEVQGKDVSAVWASSGGDLGLRLFTAADGPATLSQFKRELAGKCTWGVTSLGGLDYGYANLFNKKSGLGCKIVELGDSQSVLGALTTGRVDIMIGTGQSTDMTAAVEAGKIQVILETEDPEWRALALPEYPRRVAYGLAANLGKKERAMVGFLAGMRQAAKLYASTDADEIADQLLTVDAIKNDYPSAHDRQVLIDSIKSSKPYVNWNDGYISRADWKEFLKDTAENSGIKDFDPDDPRRSYENVVDMSFYDESKE